jgi:8-amino-7-oxononanoate synthase
MSEKAGMFGLDNGTRARLLDRLGGRRAVATKAAEVPVTQAQPRPPALGNAERYEEIRLMRQAADLLRIEDPFFNLHDGVASAHTTMAGARLSNYASYNYIGLNGDPRVTAAAKAAIDDFGTSVSASRIVSGERPLHRSLERSLADMYGTEDAVVMVSGHATNVTVIGCLLEQGDLVVHDSFSHNSIVQGAMLSGAHRASFPHNDLDALDSILSTLRPRHKQALVVVEGHYSMDGDVPDLAAIIPIVRRHRASLMVDEAHSLGVLGASGQGIAEHAGIDPNEVDIWMGTLSKSLAGCGGYIAANQKVIDFLKFTAPGFVYSVGMPPPMAAASLEALRLMRAEPERVRKLAENGSRFLQRAKRSGLDTGLSIGSAIIPIILGSSIRAVKVSHALFERGINVQPIIHPAVPERAARLRFFMSSDHEPAQIDEPVDIIAEEVARAGAERISMAALKAQLALR